MDEKQKEKRVLLPALYVGKSQFKKNGAPSGQTDAIAKAVMDLEQYPHWILGYRVENCYDIDSGLATLEQRAQLQTARIDAQQELRATLGTFQLHDWAKQPTVTGQDGTHWHPLPMRMAVRGGVSFTVEARRLQPYPNLGGFEAPYIIFPELCVTLVAVSVRAGRPGDTFDVDVLPYPINP